MLTRKYRPRSFAEMRGVELPRRALRKISREPEESPQSIILAGPWGCGKTSAARIFAKAVNCEKKDGDACNECDTCKSIHEGSLLFAELDSAIVGNVESMRSLRQSFGYSMHKGYRVIVFDEMQMCSKMSQAALLTVLEESPKGMFFLFCTTNPEAVLPTILSRSILLEYEPISEAEIRELIKNVAATENITVTECAIEYIARRVRGHARDALQQLEMVKLLGEEEYMKQGVFLESLLDDLLKAYSEGKKDEAKKIILKICVSPVMYIEQDFDIFIRKISDSVFLEDKGGNKKLRDLVFFYLKNHKLLKTTNDYYLFLSAIGSLYEERAVVTSTVNRFSR